MSKFGRKKIAITLAFASLFGSKASAMNSNKNQVKNPQTLAAVGGATNQLSPNFSNRNISGNASTWFEKLSKPAKYGLLASGSVVSAALGIFGYNLASSLFGKLARGKKFFIQYCKYFKPHSIKLSPSNLKICYTGYDEFMKKLREDYIHFNMYSLVCDFNKVTDSKLEGEALNKASIDFRNCLLRFYIYYSLKLKEDFDNIAVKNGINVFHERQENFIDFDGEAVVKPNNGKLSVCLEVIIEHKEKEIKDRFETKDITAEFNIASPKTPEEKNKKNFYDALVKYFNNNDIVKQILINN